MSSCVVAGSREQQLFPAGLQLRSSRRRQNCNSSNAQQNCSSPSGHLQRNRGLTRNASRPEPVRTRGQSTMHARSPTQRPKSSPSKDRHDLSATKKSCSSHSGRPHASVAREASPPEAAAAEKSIASMKAQLDECLAREACLLRKIEHAKSNLQCCICLQQLCCPVILKCGHIFCGPCVRSYKECLRFPILMRCPLCRSRVGQIEISSSALNVVCQAFSDSEDLSRWEAEAEARQQIVAEDQPPIPDLSILDLSNSNPMFTLIDHLSAAEFEQATDDILNDITSTTSIDVIPSVLVSVQGEDPTDQALDTTLDESSRSSDEVIEFARSPHQAVATQQSSESVQLGRVRQLVAAFERTASSPFL